MENIRNLVILCLESITAQTTDFTQIDLVRIRPKYMLGKLFEAIYCRKSCSNTTSCDAYKKINRLQKKY